MDRRDFLAKTLLAIPGIASVGHTRALSLFIGARRSSTTGTIAGEVNRADGWRWFECDGQILFPIYNSNGGLSAMYGAYLVNIKRSVGVGIGISMLEVDAVGADEKAIIRLLKYKVKNAIARGEVPIDLNGGNLPELYFGDAS